MDLPEFSFMRRNNCLSWINTEGKVNDKSKATFQVTVFATDLETGASTCVFSSERYNSYPIRSVDSNIFLKKQGRMRVPHCLKPQNILKISFIFVLSHSFKSQDSCSDLPCLNSINTVTSFSPDYPVLKTSITFFFQGWLLAKHPSTATHIWFIKQRFYNGLIGRKIYRASNFETKLYKYWKKFTEYIKKVILMAMCRIASIRRF